MQRTLRRAVAALLVAGASGLAVPTAVGAAPKPESCQGADLKRAETAKTTDAVDAFASPADIDDVFPGADARPGGGLVVNATMVIDDALGLGETSCSRLDYRVTVQRVNGLNGSAVGAPVVGSQPGDGSRRADGVATLDFVVALPLTAAPDPLWQANPSGALCYRISAATVNPGTGATLDAAPNAGSVLLCGSSGPGVKMY